MDINCPWSSMQPATLQWCERPLCEWIREPANTWSNLAYIFVGILLYYQSKKQKAPHLGLLGIFSILIGLMSGFYHASGTFLGEVLDFSTMFMMTTYTVCANLARLYGWSYQRLRAVALGGLISSIVLLVVFQNIGIELFALQMLLTFGLELKIIRAEKGKINHLPLLGFIISFSIAYIIWRLDHYRIVCNPDFHWINGHALWHILTAVGIWFVYHFYAQFKIKAEV